MTERKQQAEVPLTPTQRETRDTVRGVFRFTQGSYALVAGTVSWMKMHGYMEGLDIPKDVPPYILKLRPPKNHDPIDSQSENGQYAIQDFWDYVYDINNNDDSRTADDIRGLIIRKLYSREQHYQEFPRPGRPDAYTKPDDPNDPHASFLKKYILEENSSGIPAIDILQAELRPYILEDLATVRNTPHRGRLSPSHQQLHDVVVGWEGHHTGFNFFSGDTQPMYAEDESSPNPDSDSDVHPERTIAQVRKDLAFGRPSISTTPPDIEPQAV